MLGFGSPLVLPRREAAMTQPASTIRADSADNLSSRTPIRVLLIAAALLAIFVILAPQQSAGIGTMYSSYSAEAQGSRGLYEVIGRLGFTVSRNVKSLASPPDSTSTYVLLQPGQPLTATEQANLLGAVRHGAVLVFTANDDELTDSLGLQAIVPSDGFYTLSSTTVAGGNPPAPSVQDPRTVFQNTFPISIALKSRSKSGNQAFLWLDSQGDSTAARGDSAQRPALVLGHSLGRGYVIAIAPAPIVMNRVMRDPRAAIAIVRALQFANTAAVSQPRSNRVVFDEYHHGFGTHANVAAAVERALGETPAGRMTIEVIAAALVLLLAFAVRPIAPVSAPLLSRRSPLEHVGALAHAYLQVDARTLATGRLVRGLRRRHPLGLRRSQPDSAYLSALRDRLPTVSTDVDRIVASLSTDSHDSSDHFATTGAAVANIERAFKE